MLLLCRGQEYAVRSDNFTYLSQNQPTDHINGKNPVKIDNKNHISLLGHMFAMRKTE
jgi:hypothetical protein